MHSVSYGQPESQTLASGITAFDNEAMKLGVQVLSGTPSPQIPFQITNPEQRTEEAWMIHMCSRALPVHRFHSRLAVTNSMKLG